MSEATDRGELLRPATQEVTGSRRRLLGVSSLGALVVANMIGAGVFTTSGFALADLGSPGRVMLAWGVGGVMAVLGALCYGALAARLSESGGEYLFLSRTLHPSVGFLAGWVSIWAGFTGAIAFAAEAAQVYLAPWIPAAVPLDLVGSALIVATGVLHTIGVGVGAWVQNVVVALKVALLVGLAALGWWSLPETTGAAVAPGGFSIGAFAMTLMWVSLSYSGWNAAVYIGGEARRPSSALPRALLLGTTTVTVLYLALNWVFVHAAPVEELAGQEDVAAVAARVLGGATFEGLVRVVLVVALTTSVSSMVMIGPRVVAKMADDRVLPRWLAFTGPVPAAAIWLQVGLAVAILWASGLRQQLTNLGWILSVFTLLTVFGLVRLRRREGAERVPVPGYPFVPAAFLVLSLATTGAAMWVGARELLPALGVLVSGVAAHLLLSRFGRRTG
jgi:APA family basic amino acid/polyamine antiporter